MQTRPSPANWRLFSSKKDNRTFKRLYACFQLGNTLQNLVKRAGDAAKGNNRIRSVEKRHLSFVD